MGTKLHFLDRNDLLLLFRFFLPFLLFISIFAEIHDAAHRRFRLRRHLHKIKVLFLRQAQSIPRLHDAELLARRAGHAHFPDVDFLIDSQTILTDKNTPPPIRINNKKEKERHRATLKKIQYQTRTTARRQVRSGGLCLIERGYITIQKIRCQTEKSRARAKFLRHIISPLLVFCIFH